MSQFESTTRRAGLFTSASLAAATIAAAASFGATMTPTVAAAQATCVSTPAPTGNGTSTVTYAAGTYNPAINCAYASAAATVITSGAITVSSTAPGGGVNLTAAGSNPLTWNSAAGTVTGGAQANGPVIDAVSSSGAISITTAGVTASNATNTHGIRATSTSGTVTISATTVTATNNPAGDTAIEAVTGGAVVITTTGSVSGRLRGIYANTTSGSGAIVIDASGGTVSSIVTQAGGDADISIAASGVVNLIDVTAASGTTTTISNSGRIGSDNASAAGNLVVTSGAAPGQVVIDNSGRLQGRVDLSGVAGGVEVNTLSGGVWRFADTSLLGAGADRVTIAEGGLWVTGVRQSTFATIEDPTVIAFGGGVDLVTNEGVIVIGPHPRNSLNTEVRHNFEAELRVEGLEQFVHSGLILLGGGDNERTDSGTDGWYDDILSMPGAHYVGDGGEIVFDVDLSRTGQTACDPSLRDDGEDFLLSGDMPAADCVAIIGGSTEGTTYVTINDIFAGERGIYNPDGIVLIDLGGGTSAAGHFMLGPNSDFYSSANGGVVDKGVFFYSLVYDDAAQQHKLVGLPGANAQQFPLLGQAAHSLWRVSTGTWLERQADLRGQIADVGGGVWFRGSTEIADRDVVQSQDAYGNTFVFDNTFSQTSYAFTGGADVLSGGGDDAAYVIGVMAGYAHADIDYDASINTAWFDGWTGGAYASVIAGGFFVDAAVNANKLILKNDVPSLDLFPAGTILSTDLLSVGAQAEAGWRLPFMAGAFVEPLAGVSYVRTKYDGFNIPSDDPARPRIDVEFDDPTSLRASVGGRAGLEQDYGSFRAQFSVLGRLWNEFEGESGVTLVNAGADPVVSDEFTGTFTEFGLGASLYSATGGVSGFLNLGGKFGDDYDAQTASAGVRVNW